MFFLGGDEGYVLCFYYYLMLLVDKAMLIHTALPLKANYYQRHKLSHLELSTLT